MVLKSCVSGRRRRRHQTISRYMEVKAISEEEKKVVNYARSWGTFLSSEKNAPTHHANAY